VKLSLVQVGCTVRRAKGSAIAAFVAVITDIQNLGTLFDAIGLQVRDLDCTAHTFHLLNRDILRFQRKGNVRAIGADCDADPAEIITLQAAATSSGIGK
jgi:hypothetical protein